MFYILMCFVLIFVSILVLFKPSLLPKWAENSTAKRKTVLKVTSFFSVFLFLATLLLLVNQLGNSSEKAVISSQEMEVTEKNEAKEDEKNTEDEAIDKEEAEKKNVVENNQEKIAYIDVSVATLWSEPDIVRLIDEPSISSPVDIWKWTMSMSVAQKKWLVGILQTQALYGQTVSILEEREEWVQVAVHGQPTPKSDLGYVAWMPKGQLADSKEFTGIKKQNSFAIITKPTSWLYSDENRQDKFKEISFNTRLPVISQMKDATLVATPSDGNMWISSEAVTVYKSEQDIPNPTGDVLVKTGEQFLGLPYLWAGTSGFGFDCSGFTYSIYNANGITIPRDSSVQATQGISIEKEDLKKGDLLFFAYEKGKGSVHHVGMYIGDGKMMHSPNTESTVEVIKVFESEYYASEYAGARRYINQ